MKYTNIAVLKVELKEEHRRQTITEDKRRFIAELRKGRIIQNGVNEGSGTSVWHM